MSNLEVSAQEHICTDEPHAAPPPPLELLEPRNVPPGRPRPMSVRRTLPQRTRSLIGAWCFLDR